VANPERPGTSGTGTLVSGPATRHWKLRQGFHSMKQEASPAAGRFTARTGEDRSFGRAGMDGVKIPGPESSRDGGWPAAARDIVKLAK